MTSPSVHNLNYLVYDGDVVKLKERHNYYFQVQGQMGVSKIPQAIFFVFTHHGYFSQCINFVNYSELFSQMLIKFNYFWSKYVVPEIIKCQSLVRNSEGPLVTMIKENNVINATDSIFSICMKESTTKPKSPA